MDKEFFDKILDQVIEEASTMYVENEAKKNIEIDDTEFSELHNQKMKKIFREAKMREVRKNAVRVTKKIAVIVLCTILLTAGLITSVEAWREEFVRFIMKNNDDNYMSIKFGDTTSGEVGQDKNESGDIVENEPFIIDDIKFMYLPKESIFAKKEVDNSLIYYSFYVRRLLY